MYVRHKSAFLQPLVKKQFLLYFALFPIVKFKLSHLKWKRNNFFGYFFYPSEGFQEENGNELGIITRC